MGFGSWGERFNPQRRQSLPTPLADILSCQWCGKPPLSMSRGGHFCAHSVQNPSTSASKTLPPPNGIPDGGTNPGVRYIQIFRYSDIQIFRKKKKKGGGGVFSPKKKKKKKKKK